LGVAAGRVKEFPRPAAPFSPNHKATNVSAKNRVRDWLTEHGLVSKGATDLECSDAAIAASSSGQLDEATLNQLIQKSEGKTMTSTEAFGGTTDKSGIVNVKAPSERYNDVRYSTKHAKTGKPVHDQKGAEVQSLSERTTARVGAFLKWRASRNGVNNFQLTEHEQAMVAEMFDSKETWVGEFNGEYRDNWTGTQVKALLSDSTSGGVYVNPLWYDQAIITFPLLNGEIFPFVDVVEVPRSNVVNSASISNPTVTWGQTDGTAISVFDTTSLVGQLNTSIFNCMIAVEVGRNELADSIVNVGQYLVQVIGERYAAELDKIIAIGDGTTQPQGIVNASGLATLPNLSNGLGPMSLGDLEQLYFGIGKQYRKPAFRCAFISNDTTYSRCRAIPVGSDDARRVLGQDEGSYDALSAPYRISNDLPNTKLIFGALARYRFYRRSGQEMRWETAGQTLALKNTALLISYMRCGGRVMDTNAFIAETNCPA
jgi:HK97 family phage major capsid protein